MATVNSARQAWATRTLLEELRRESREIMWQRLAQARPMPGVPLPRPCDPRPGHFIDQMTAKAHTMFLETVKQAVGYDSRFLLPEGEKVLALPVPELKPVDAVATRVIKLQSPAPMPVQAAAILLDAPARRVALTPRRAPRKPIERQAGDTRVLIYVDWDEHGVWQWHAKTIGRGGPSARYSSPAELLRAIREQTPVVSLAAVRLARYGMKAA